MRTAVYAGTFDPVTNGHLDVLERACRIFDRVIVAVAVNKEKGPLFETQERIDLIKPSVKDNPQVEVTSFDGLLIDFVRDRQAHAIVRGLRAVSDFEFEFQMTQMNRDLDPEFESVFFMPSQDYFFTSSTLVKQVAAYSPDRIRKFVPLNVAAALKKRLGHD